jgi:hypothetical protein
VVEEKRCGDGCLKSGGVVRAFGVSNQGFDSPELRKVLLPQQNRIKCGACTMWTGTETGTDLRYRKPKCHSWAFVPHWGKILRFLTFYRNPTLKNAHAAVYPPFHYRDQHHGSSRSISFHPSPDQLQLLSPRPSPLAPRGDAPAIASASPRSSRWSPLPRCRYSR